VAVTKKVIRRNPVREQNFLQAIDRAKRESPHKGGCSPLIEHTRARRRYIHLTTQAEGIHLKHYLDMKLTAIVLTLNFTADNFCI